MTSAQHVADLILATAGDGAVLDPAALGIIGAWAGAPHRSDRIGAATPEDLEDLEAMVRAWGWHGPLVDAVQVFMFYDEMSSRSLERRKKEAAAEAYSATEAVARLSQLVESTRWC